MKVNSVRLKVDSSTALSDQLWMFLLNDERLQGRKGSAKSRWAKRFTSVPKKKSLGNTPRKRLPRLIFLENIKIREVNRQQGAAVYLLCS